MKKVLELARRNLRSDRPPRALELLAGGGSGLAARQDSRVWAGAGSSGSARGEPHASSGLPEVWNQGIGSFYDLLREPGAPRRCSGTACHFVGGRSEGAGEGGPGLEQRPAAAVHCLGRCYEAPTSTETQAAAIPRLALSAAPVVLRHLLGAGHATRPRAGSPSKVWSDYELPEGGAVLDTITASALRGRGGAAYLAGAKWKVARDTPAPARYVVANGDEGDPGAYIDRLLLEEAPHSVLAGMIACGRAVGATRGVVYVRAEYPRAAECVRQAAREARGRGVLGDFEVEVVSGAGSYVAGEETALLRSIEGLRAEPSPKPPYPASSGLYGLPTIVHNVETLSVIPWVVANRRRADTKAVCLAGAVARPGVVEIDLGTSLRRVLEEGGGGRGAGSIWKMALIGGPLGRVVGAADFDVALSFEDLPGMGHAGVVVLDQTVSARALAQHLFAFARSESCGSCAPCRIGSAQLESRRTVGDLERLLETMEAGSLCGFGQGVARPLRDLLRLYGDEVTGARGAAR